jgi:hypothetical protein
MTLEEVCSYIEKWAKEKNTGRIEINLVKGEITNIYGTYYTIAGNPPSPGAQG